MNKTMLLKPRLSEKTYSLSQQLNAYVFDVPKTANKLSIAQAVAAQFSVTVETVNISVRHGKQKLSYRRGSRPIKGRQSDTKRAYVRLKQGDSIPVFTAVEEAAAAEASGNKKAQEEAKT